MPGQPISVATDDLDETLRDGTEGGGGDFEWLGGFTGRHVKSKTSCQSPFIYIASTLFCS